MAGTERVLTLPELQKRALRALDDARLVCWARDESLKPREVLRLAQGLKGLSRRQPEAARCMAVIRRDYGLEALDLFISSMARARAELSATEQAHRGEIMDTRVLQSIVGLTDVRKKFELLLKNGYAKEAAEFLLELATNGTAFCWLSVGQVRIANPLGDEFCQEKSGSAISSVVFVFRREIGKGFFPLDDQEQKSESELSIRLVSLVPMLEKAGLTETCRVVAMEIVKAVLENTVKHDPRGEESPANYWNVVGTTATARELWPVGQRNLENNSLAFQVEIWQARFHFFVGDLGPLTQQVLPSLDDGYRGTLETYQQLDWLVDYLQECGWTIEQVCQEFIDWLERHAEHNLNNQVFVAVAGSARLQYGLSLSKAHFALHKRLEFCWRQLCNEDPRVLSLEMFVQLGRLGLFSKDDASFFLRELTDLLARGRVALTAQIVRVLCSLTSVGLCQCFSGPYSALKKTVLAELGELAPEAFDLAIERQAFGVAAALGQHFNCVDEAALRLEANRSLRAKLDEIIPGPETMKSADREEVLLYALDGTCPSIGDEEDCSDATPELIVMGMPGKGWNGTLTHEQAEKYFDVRAQRDELLKTLVEIRKTVIKGSVETALALEMPIALEVVTLL